MKRFQNNIWKYIKHNNKLFQKHKKHRTKKMTIMDWDRESIVSFINYVHHKKKDKK